MALDRDALRSQLSSFQAAISAANDRWTAWNNGATALSESASSDDREWLEDRLSDLAWEFGFPSERAEMQRLLASKGLMSDIDETPAPGPHPYYEQFTVGLASDLVTPTAPQIQRDPRDFDRSTIPERLAKFQPGGHGQITWGPTSDNLRVWVSHARPGATKFDVQDHLQPIRDALTALGLRFQVEVFTKIFVDPPNLPPAREPTGDELQERQVLFKNT